jgi:GH18 family chitinase
MKKMTNIKILSSLICIFLASLSQAIETHGRFSGWSIYTPGFNISDINARSLDVIYYDSFKLLDIDEDILILPTDDWADLQQKADPLLPHVAGNLPQLIELRKSQPDLKVILSIGGYTYSDAFSNIMRSPKKRQTLIKNLHTFKEKYGIDGYDFDWKYPVHGNAPEFASENDGRNFNRFLREIFEQHPDWITSIHLPMDILSLKQWDLRLTAKYVDYMQLASFNYHGSWSPLTYLHNALYTNEEGARVGQQSFNNLLIQYSELGLPSEKIVLNAAPIAARWNNADQLYSTYQSTPKGVWQQDGYFSLPQIAKELRDWHSHWDSQSRVHWLEDHETGHVISYESAESIREKVYYARSHKLAAISMNEMFNDYRSNQSLVLAMEDAIDDYSLWYLNVRDWWMNHQKSLFSWVLIIGGLLLVACSVLWALLHWWQQVQHTRQKQEYRYLYQQLDQLFDASLQTQDFIQQIEYQGLEHHLATPEIIDILATQSQQQVEWLNHFHWHLNPPAFDALNNTFLLGELLQPLSRQMQLVLNERYFSWEVSGNYRQLWHTILQFEPKLGSPNIEFIEYDQQLKMQLNYSLEALGAHQVAELFDWLHQNKHFGLSPDYQPLKKSLALSWVFNARTQKQVLSGINADKHKKVITADNLPERIKKLQQDWQTQDPDSQIQSFLKFFDDYGVFTGRVLKQKHQKEPSSTSANVQHDEVWQHKFEHHNEQKIHLFSKVPLDSSEKWLFQALATQLETMQNSLRHLVRSPQLLNELHLIASRKDQLLFIKADKGYSKLVFSLQKKTPIISLRLRQIQNYFDRNTLLQVHRSWLINPNKVKAVKVESKRRWWIELEHKKIPIGQKYMQDIQQRYPFWFHEDTH